MNPLSRIINLGTNRETNPVFNKHIRFTNAVTLIVLGFIFPNMVMALQYHEHGPSWVLMAHFILITLVFVFNAQGKRILASSWWSIIAIPAVTYYGVVFTAQGLNFTFLPMVLFLQFFLFSSSDKWNIVFFSGFTMLCYAFVLVCFQNHWAPFGQVSEGLIYAQRINSMIGLPVLSLAFGLYAYFSITGAEREVANEKAKTEKLLLNILPAPVAERFKNDQSVLAQGYESVSVLFADIVDFTSFSEKTPPDQLLHFLNDVFLKFDAITEKYGLEKIKTIGDAYMVAGGVPELSHDHLKKICDMALDMQETIVHIKTPSGEPLRMRMGISTGPVTAGVIGAKKFIYDLWGDTVNTASRMESHSEADCIQITSEVYDVICDGFECQERGVIQVKGKREMRTWFLVGRKQYQTSVIL